MIFKEESLVPHGPTIIRRGTVVQPLSLHEADFDLLSLAEAGETDVAADDDVHAAVDAPVRVAARPEPLPLLQRARTNIQR